VVLIRNKLELFHFHLVINVSMMHQTCFAGLMGSLHISGVCIMTKIYTQLDGARLTASPFSHPHDKVSDMVNVIVNYKTVDCEARVTTT